MDKEQEISEEIKKFQEMAKDEKSIDLAALALNKLQNPGNFVSTKAKRWAYIISLLFPPLGIFIAIYFFLRDEQDSNTVAWFCVALTGLAVFLTWLIFSLLLSGSGVSVNQIEQIDPEELKQLFQ